MGAVDKTIEDSLSASLRIKLVSSLNDDDKWKRIVEGLERFQVFLNTERMRDAVRNNRTTPADWVLDELIDRNCPFDEFCFMLREFDLLEELTLLIPAEPMEIQVEPGNGESSICVNKGDELRLTCLARGLPRPTYQWYRDNDLIQGQTTTVLSIRPFSQQDIGIYKCQVSQELLGKVVERDSCDVDVDLTKVRPVLLMDLPGVCSVARGQPLILEVQAEGYPLPDYYWYRALTVCGDTTEAVYVPNENSNIFELKETQPEDEGIYMCRVYNKAGLVDSRHCTLHVVENPPGYMASAKVALLIGNEKYLDKELEGLHAPSNDVETLAKILEELNFHVIALQNLTHSEMYLAFLWFRSIFPENAYALFYFAGHGCSKLNSNCVMPIDCPKNNYQLSDVWCDEQIKQIFSEGKQLQLLVMLFDCCRVEASDLSIGNTQFEHDFGNCNVVVGTATRNYHNAFEADQDSNGLFVNHLKIHMLEDKPIVEILQANQKDFQNELQTPTVLITGSQNHSLRDPVEGNGETERYLRSEIDFKSYEKEIYFSKTNESFTIRISKHKDCFLNSIDLEFPCNFIHNFDVVVNSQDVELKVEHRVVTVYNIQRIKSPLSVTVFINGLRQADGGFVSGPHDSYEFDLDCPSILQRRGPLLSS